MRECGVELDSRSGGPDGAGDREHVAMLHEGHDDVCVYLQYILPFALDRLPEQLHNDMIINVTGAGIKSSLRRRFARAWKANSTNTVQVDHSTRGLLLDGKPWAILGWYVYPYTSFEGPRGGPCDPKNNTNKSAPIYGDCIRWGIGNMTLQMERMADRGVTAIMPYNFNPYEHDGIGGLPIDELRGLILKYFDEAHRHGLKILHHLASMELDRGHYTNVTLAQLQETVALVKDHPALLAYYFCDDCGQWQKDQRCMNSHCTVSIQPPHCS